MKLELPRQIFEKYSNTKFQENPSSDSWLFSWVRTGERRDRHHEAKFYILLTIHLVMVLC